MAVHAQLIGSILCLTTMAGSLHAQNQPATRTINGQVINTVTGEPVARARVQMSNQPAVLTDHEGNFPFEYTEGQTFWPSVAKPGYFADDPESFTPTGPVTLRLTPEAILFGTVTDQDGEPIPDLKVELSAFQVTNGMKRWQVTQTTTTNAEGQYRFAELHAGKYRIMTGYHVDGLPDAPSSVVLPPVVLPPPAGDGASSALTLKPGQQMEANANPIAEPLQVVSGEINGLTGQGLVFRVETLDGAQIDAPVRFYSDGVFRFRLRLPSGTFRIRAQEGVPQQLSATREITVGDAPLEGVVITLNPVPMIPLEEEYQAVNSHALHGPPPAYPNASLESADPQEPPRVVAATPLNPKPRVEPLHFIPETGPMVFRDLEPGRYRLQTPPGPDWYVASATCGNVDLTRELLVIGTATAPCTLHIVYRDDGATFQFSALPPATGYAGSAAWITLIPLDNLSRNSFDISYSAARTISLTSPLEGTFPGIAPGRYLVLALPKRKDLAYRDPEVLEKLSKLGQEVTLTRGGKGEVQLTIVDELGDL